MARKVVGIMHAGECITLTECIILTSERVQDENSNGPCHKGFIAGNMASRIWSMLLENIHFRIPQEQGYSNYGGSTVYL